MSEWWHGEWERGHVAMVDFSASSPQSSNQYIDSKLEYMGIEDIKVEDKCEKPIFSTFCSKTIFLCA